MIESNKTGYKRDDEDVLDRFNENRIDGSKGSKLLSNEPICLIIAIE